MSSSRSGKDCFVASGTGESPNSLSISNLGRSELLLIVAFDDMESYAVSLWNSIESSSPEENILSLSDPEVVEVGRE